MIRRWQFIFGEVEVDSDKEFGDYHKFAVDETWYVNFIYWNNSNWQTITKFSILEVQSGDSSTSDWSPKLCVLSSTCIRRGKGDRRIESNVVARYFSERRWSWSTRISSWFSIFTFTDVQTFHGNYVQSRCKILFLAVELTYDRRFNFVSNSSATVVWDHAMMIDKIVMFSTTMHTLCWPKGIM